MRNYIEVTEQLKMELPAMPKAVSEYVPIKYTGSSVTVSGQGPICNGKRNSHWPKINGASVPLI